MKKKNNDYVLTIENVTTGETTLKIALNDATAGVVTSLADEIIKLLEKASSTPIKFASKKAEAEYKEFRDKKEKDKSKELLN